MADGFEDEVFEPLVIPESQTRAWEELQSFIEYLNRAMARLYGWRPE